MLQGTVHQDGGAAFNVCVISRTAVFKNNIKSPGKLYRPPGTETWRGPPAGVQVWARASKQAGEGAETKHSSTESVSSHLERVDFTAQDAVI